MSTKRLQTICAATVAMGSLFAADAYIESDGTQFINTGYHPNGKTKIAVDFQLTSTASGKDCVFGNYGYPLIGRVSCAVCHIARRLGTAALPTGN